jgi:hypothetical protein
MKWLRIIKEKSSSTFGLGLYFYDEALGSFMSVNIDTKIHSIWEEFEKIFSNRWFKDTKMEEMHAI